MAFQQVTVENRVSEFPNRRTLTKEDNTTEIVTVTRNEGNVSTEGTAWGAAYANDLESRINTETNLLETNFGHVETNTTASKSYSVGEALVLNGQMYKVTAAIAQGATLTVGTNIAVHSVSTINSNLNGLTFAKGADGKWGYKIAGADPVIPFKRGAEKTPLACTISTNFNNAAGSGDSTNLTAVATIPVNGYSKFVSGSEYTISCYLLNGTSQTRSGTTIDISDCYAIGISIGYSVKQNLSSASASYPFTLIAE